MSVSLTKGQKINLSKEVQGLKKVRVGLGWDAANSGLKGLFGIIKESEIDCDASAIILFNENSYADTVYFAHKSSMFDCVHHHGDSLTGDKKGDDEQITVNLKDMPANVERIVFVVNIYNCVGRKQDFGMIKNAYIRLVDVDTNKEICRYNLSDDYKGKTAMIMGEVYKHNNEWKFNAIGTGTNDTSLSGLINRYK